MKVLICNAGSTSLKFKLYEMPECTVLARCKIERVGSQSDAIFQFVNERTGQVQSGEKQAIPDYLSGIARFLGCLTDPGIGPLLDIREVERVGYKATASKGNLGVHEITDEVIFGMEEWLPIAPLHNRAYLDTIAAMREALPDALFLGAFETAFHLGMPLCRRIYGVPYEWYEKYGVQRLGYHSASHGYIADRLGEACLEGYKAASCHLGGSSSVCAILDGVSVDTSFGMSLQSGLIHANRVGDMDGDLYEYLRAVGLSDAEIANGMQKDGGLLGLSGVSADLRYIEEAADAGNVRAKLAMDAFVDGIVRYIGAFHVEMGGLTHIVFTGGIGENSRAIRRMVCEKLGVLGVILSDERNLALRGEGEVSAPESGVKVLVIPTDEELGIARRTYAFER